MTYINPKEYKEEYLNATNEGHLEWYDEGVADLLDFPFGDEIKDSTTVIPGSDEWGHSSNIAVINIGSCENLGEWLDKNMRWFIEHKRKEWIVHWLDQQAEDMEEE